MKQFAHDGITAHTLTHHLNNDYLSQSQVNHGPEQRTN